MGIARCGGRDNLRTQAFANLVLAPRAALAITRASFSYGALMRKPPKMHRQPWTAAEIKTLRKMSKEKAGLSKMAKELQRSTWSVRNRAYAEGISLSTR